MQEMLISLLENKSYKETESEFIVSAAECIENTQSHFAGNGEYSHK